MNQLPVMQTFDSEHRPCGERIRHCKTVPIDRKRTEYFSLNTFPVPVLLLALAVIAIACVLSSSSLSEASSVYPWHRNDSTPSEVRAHRFVLLNHRGDEVATIDPTGSNGATLRVGGPDAQSRILLSVSDTEASIAVSGLNGCNGRLSCRRVGGKWIDESANMVSLDLTSGEAEMTLRVDELGRGNVSMRSELTGLGSSIRIDRGAGASVEFEDRGSTIASYTLLRTAVGSDFRTNEYVISPWMLSSCKIEQADSRPSSNGRGDSESRSNR